MTDSLPAFAMEETVSHAGQVRLRLSGELDMASAGRLERRLGELAQAGSCVILDLSELRFIDSTGLRVIITAVTRARRDGWDLTVDRRVVPAVRRVFELVHVDGLLWPNPAER